jgi:hypothetical protein
MPKIRREKLPRAVLRHLSSRLIERGISIEQLREILKWMESEPIVPESAWFKRFAGVTICGEGELVKTFLTPNQIPFGAEI